MSRQSSTHFFDDCSTSGRWQPKSEKKNWVHSLNEIIPSPPTRITLEQKSAKTTSRRNQIYVETMSLGGHGFLIVESFCKFTGDQIWIGWLIGAHLLQKPGHQLNFLTACPPTSSMNYQMRWIGRLQKHFLSIFNATTIRGMGGRVSLLPSFEERLPHS